MNGPADNEITFDVELTLTQIVLIRQLLFVELHRAAEALVDQAHGAHEGGGASPLDGIDARGTWCNCLQPIAELLDMVGWDTRTDAQKAGE
jgi:hypothetical protein